MAEPLRIGVIGAGWNTKRRHIPGFQEIEGVEVAAVCNRSEESGRAAAEQFGIPRVETDPYALFNDPEIDAICIGTWPYKHHEYVIAALEAGKHVLTEARLAMNTAEAREMLEVSRRHPELVAQVVPAPYDFRTRDTTRRLIREGALGQILEVHASALSSRGLDPNVPLGWRDQQRYSGVNMIGLGIWLESLNYWIGDLESVMADGSIHIKERVDPETGQVGTVDLPDSLSLLGRYPDGARLNLRMSTVTHAPAQPDGIAIYGTEATLHWWWDGDRIELARAGEKPQPVEPDPGTASTWRVEQDFVDSIREGKPVTLTTFEDGVRYMQATEAIFRSMQERREVALSEV